MGAEAYSPCEFEPHHPDLFWYGVHGVESLYTVMGTGCQTVVRVSLPDTDVVVGIWDDSRVGTFRGLRIKGMQIKGKEYGGIVFGMKGIEMIGPSEQYRPLVAQIAQFFRTRKSPVDPKETIEIYTFMEAGDESKHRGGIPIPVKEVFEKASLEARRNPLR